MWLRFSKGADMEHVLVVGGGASGMMAAIAAAKQGAEVTILEQNEQMGKKILSTGNGKCNFTNINDVPGAYRGEHPEFAREVIRQFPVPETIRFFMELGLYSKTEMGICILILSRHPQCGMF